MGGATLQRRSMATLHGAVGLSPASRWPLGLVMVLAMGGCGGSSPVEPGARLAIVEFVYRAPTTVDATVLERFRRCVEGVGRTHIHPSWRSFVRFDMNPAGADRWQITFVDVPTEQTLAVRLNDPNACATHPHGASLANVFANGVLLIRVVETPGPDHGVNLNPPGVPAVEPGLALRVAEDGTVMP